LISAVKDLHAKISGREPERERHSAVHNRFSRSWNRLQA
jgi:hypothetical protein